MTQVGWTRYTATTLANTDVYRCFARYTKCYRSLRPLHFGVLFAVRILNMLPESSTAKRYRRYILLWPARDSAKMPTACILLRHYSQFKRAPAPGWNFK